MKETRSSPGFPRGQHPHPQASIHLSGPDCKCQPPKMVPPPHRGTGLVRTRRRPPDHRSAGVPERGPRPTNTGVCTHAGPTGAPSPSSVPGSASAPAARRRPGSRPPDHVMGVSLRAGGVVAAAPPTRPSTNENHRRDTGDRPKGIFSCSPASPTTRRMGVAPSRPRPRAPVRYSIHSAASTEVEPFISPDRRRVRTRRDLRDFVSHGWISAPHVDLTSPSLEMRVPSRRARSRPMKTSRASSYSSFTIVRPLRRHRTSMTSTARFSREMARFPPPS